MMMYSDVTRHSRSANINILANSIMDRIIRTHVK